MFVVGQGHKTEPVLHEKCNKILCKMIISNFIIAIHYAV